MVSSGEDFDQGDSGASKTELAEAGRMKPGSLIMMKEEFPCKVTAFSTAKPGKHGSAKAMITAKDIFTDKQYDETFGTGDMIPRPVISKTEYNCIDVDEDGALSLMDDEGNLIQHLNLPHESHLSDVPPKIKSIVEDGSKECLVTVLKWGDKEQVISVREGKEAS